MNFCEPNAANYYLEAHAVMLAMSYRRWLGDDLIIGSADLVAGKELARALYESPFAIVSHGTQADPIFNYGNLTALRLFEMTWDEFTRLPSRISAEPIHRNERQRLMDEVTRNGFIPDYRGVRISKNGRRFLIERATVWNIVESSGALYGQAAMFADWRFLDSPAMLEAGRA